MEITGIIITTSLLMSLCFIASGSFTVELNIPNTILAGKTVSGSCTYTGKHRPKFIKIKSKQPDCSVEGLPAAHELLRPSQYVNDFNVTCSRSNITFEVECFAYCPSTNEHKKAKKTVQVISKPKIVSPPVTATVTRPGLPITLSCQVDADPNHYWVGWFYKTSIIKNEDDDHSVSVSPNFRSQQGGTTHHLTVHSVKHDGKYQCLVYTIREGSVVDQLTHQVTVLNGERTDQSSSILDMILRS